MSIKYEAVIGLEIHAQLKTNSKIFCGCPTTFGREPNSQTCPVCIGMPGVLPVMNKKVIEYTIKTGLATNCTITGYSRFARKHYFYPDLPKNYQISQYAFPICTAGHVIIHTDEGPKTIGITRIHMEEDAGKNIHDSGGHFSLVDLNRTGVPLMEIVSEPDLRTAKDAASYVRKLRSLVRYLDVCDGNMEEGSLRCDANVSIRPHGATTLGTKAEIKNINSFKFVEKAIEYEIKRQERVIRDGGRVIQETRLFNPTTGTTHSMRSKEEAHDYRYFPEPDLVAIVVTDSQKEEIRQTLPELPDALYDRFTNEFGLPAQDADQLTAERQTAKWFMEVVKLGANPKSVSNCPKSVSNWMIGEFTRLLNQNNVAINESLVKPAHLKALLDLIESGKINAPMAKSVFETMFATGKTPDAIVSEKGLSQISDKDAIEAVVCEVIDKHIGEVTRYKTGEVKLLGFLVGAIMKASKGKANPQLVNEILKEKLG